MCTWFPLKYIWSVIGGAQVWFPVAAELIIFFLFFDSVLLLFHSYFQSWQIRSIVSILTLNPFAMYFLKLIAQYVYIF